jgi:hypothetical protein
MGDKITNWYEKLPTDLKNKTKLDNNFKKHYIQPNSMIVCIGGTGAGKSNALLEFLSRKNDAFFEIIIFNPTSTDEPLYNLIKQKMPDVQMISDIKDLPELKTFEDDRKNEKLLIVDDFINLPKKDMKKINEYFTGGRKAGFTVWAMAQNYTSVPKIVTRNANYFIIFKLNDTVTINNVLKNHNINNIDKDQFKAMYLEATDEPRNFFMVDLKGGKLSHLRKNFLDFY